MNVKTYYTLRGRTILTITATGIIFKRQLGPVSDISDSIGLAGLVVDNVFRWSSIFCLISYRNCLVDFAKYVLMSDIGFVGTIKTEVRLISGKGKHLCRSMNINAWTVGC